MKRRLVVTLVGALVVAVAGGGTASGTPTELFISEYIEGTSNNKAIEIYNGTGAAVNLNAGGYGLFYHFNGNPSAGLAIPLTGTVASGDVYVVAQSTADPAILAQADQTDPAGWFNGDDAVVLRKGGAAGPILDVIGQIGFDPGTEWGSGLTSTMDNTLRRKASIEAGDTNGADAFDPALEWDGFAVNTFDGLGAHPGMPDAGPSVSSTSPSDGATGVPTDANITINFSEPVNVAGEWFGIFCGTSGGHTAAVSGGPTTFTLDPDANFAPDEQCAVTVKADHVSDQDTNDPPDNMAMNYTFTFRTGTPPDAAPSVTSTNPANGASNVPVDSNIRIDFSEPVAVAPGWYSISCATSGAHTATQSGGPQSYTLNPDADFAFSETCTVTIFASQVTDQDTNDPPDNMSSDYAFTFTTAAPPLQIHDIQGAAHISPYSGQSVSGVEGIVTWERSSSFYMQGMTPDANNATSEAVVAFGSGLGALVNVGDHVRVSGTVLEFRPGGSGSDNLTTTEITTPGLSVSVLSPGNPLPASTVVGAGGRVPPSDVIEDDASGSVETSGVFDPVQDGIDFYESLEGMRVQVNNAVVVGPTNQFGEVFVLADNGAGATVRTSRGGIVVRDVDPTPPGDDQLGDFNPERIQLDDTLLFGSSPTANVGDHFATPAVGILDYNFGNFELNLTAPLTRVDEGLQREVTRAPIDQEIVVGTYNVENLDPGDGPASFARHADLIVNNLRSPDLIAIEEVQDNDGATNSAVTDASATWNTLISAIQSAGGPTYQYRQIDPVDDQDGGQPGGNIRVGFLFRTDRGLEFIDRPGGDSTTPTTVVDHPAGPRLSFSPGRVDPQDRAFVDTRKSLAGEFRMRGKKVFVVVNHLSSKGDDDPLFGRWQPPIRYSEEPNAAGDGGRHPQAQVVNDFVDQILAADPQANVIVLGDINDFEFSETVEILEGGVLTTLMDTLPKPERYSYVFEGNSQVLDQILVSNNMLGNFPIEYDPVHVNAEFADQASDHDPQVARLDLRGRPRQ